MKFRIENLAWESDGLFGEDVVTFTYDVIVEDPDDSFDSFVSLSALISFVRENNPSLHEYISAVHESVSGWGPCEGKLMNELGDDLDFKSLIEEMLEKKGWFIFEYEREIRIRAMPKEEKKKADDFVKHFEKDQEEQHLETRNYYDFCESTDKAIHEIALRIYPGILDMPKEKVKEFKTLFVREIQDMQSRLMDFLADRKT